MRDLIQRYNGLCMLVMVLTGEISKLRTENAELRRVVFGEIREIGRMC